MLYCKDVEALWTAWSEGRLSHREAEDVGRHLRDCERCARFGVALEQLEFGLEDLASDGVEVPSHLKTRIMARLDDVEIRKPWFSFLTSRRILAVSTACLAFFAGLLVRELHRVNQWAPGWAGREVVLEFQSPGARQVMLAGDFNGWGRETGQVRSDNRDGHWVFRVRLEPGRYNYSFVVDGKKWLPDPGAPGIIPDGFGGMNSVLYVPDRPSPQGRVL